MTPSTIVKLTLTALVAAASAVPAHGARPSHAGTARVVAGMSGVAFAAEPKNEPPFTAPYNADPGYAKAIRVAASGVVLRRRFHRS